MRPPPPATRMRSARYEAVTAVLKGQKDHVFEYACRSQDGERWFEMAVEPFRRPEGGAVISYIDITRRHHAEEEARRQREELAHAQRVTTLGELSASLAHEINQPLAAIVTNAQAAVRLLNRQGVAHTDVSEALTDMAADARRASAIIQRLRALSRKEHAPRAGLDLNELIDDVVSLLRHDFVRKQITVLRAFDPVVPTVSGDPVQLQQVILNLLVKRERGDRADRRRQARGRDRDPLPVAGSGRGRGARQRHRREGVRSRADFRAVREHEAGGLGMGLAISRSIVEAHGGQIRAIANPRSWSHTPRRAPVRGERRPPERHAGSLSRSARPYGTNNALARSEALGDSSHQTWLKLIVRILESNTRAD